MKSNPFLDALFLKRKSRRGMEEHRSFAALLGHPERDFPSIHIAGSNGKGSVAIKIAAGLEASGKKVGLFSSPHLIDFEERITINGKRIEQEEVVKRGEKILRQLPSLSFFEVTTFIAFEHFRDAKVDIAVIEAGIGGAYDVTNVVFPRLSVITSISLEHQELLGDTLEEIALEKAQIIKPGISAVIGQTAVLAPVIARGKAVGSSLILVPPVVGPYEIENQAIARTAMEHLALSHEEIQIGCEKRAPCRFQRDKDVIYDVAHNPGGFLKLKEALEYYYPGKTFSFVVGISKDKKAEACLRALIPICEIIICVAARSSRALEAEKLGAIAAYLGLNYQVATSVKEGITRAKAAANHVVICGSFYLMEEAILDQGLSWD